jgi:polysaccharide deacetylase family protein (PEP-CTERM system associated)
MTPSNTGAALRPEGYGRAVPVFTVDVEDWFQVSAFDSCIERASWDTMASRVERNTDRLLQLCDETGTIGTFFTLGWVADRFPQLVRRIVNAGHEIASHGYWHQRITTIGKAEFREDVRRAKAVLEDTSGISVSGYRAPSFSLTDQVPWAVEVLIEEGYAYDSSRFPISRPGYGTASGARTPHFLRSPAGTLAEYPPAVWPLAGVQIPVAGGGWFRQFPGWITRLGFQAVLDSSQPAVFYIHPWEVDPEQPRMAVNTLTRLRHYRGLAEAEDRLRHLLARWPFRSFANLRAGSVKPCTS